LKESNILISAIVSTYNSERFIKGKIEDLLNQTVADRLEIIIINSGSLQNEERIIREYLENHANIKYIRTQERETIYKAWNRGIKNAAGKYITNANTDDRLKNDAYEILSNELEKHPDVALVHADMYISDLPNQKYEEIGNAKVEIIPEFDYLVQLDRCLVFSQPMWRASLHYKDNIWFREELKICGDHEFEINISRNYKLMHIPLPLGVFYLDKNRSNISHNDISAVENEKLQITADYISEYIGAVGQNELMSLKDKFEFSTRIPIPVLRGRNIILGKLNPRVHQFTHEFVYFLMALVYLRLDNLPRAAAISKKLLKRKKSARVKNLLTKLENKLHQVKR